MDRDVQDCNSVPPMPVGVPGARIGQPRSVHVKCGVTSAHVVLTIGIWVARVSFEHLIPVEHALPKRQAKGKVGKSAVRAL